MEPIINICFLDHAVKMGGAQYSLYYLIKYLRKDSTKPFIIIPPLSELSKKLEGNYSIAHCEFVSPIHIIKFIKNILFLKKYIKKNNINVIHCNTYLAIQYGVILKIISNCKLVWHVRNFFPKPILKWIYSITSDEIICISKAVSKQFNSNVLEKITIIYNGVDFTEYKIESVKGSLREELNISQKMILVGMVGRIDRWKNIHYFIKAADRIINDYQYDNYLFFVVGDSILTKDKNYKYELYDLVKKKNLNNSLYFLGQRNDIPNIMASFDLTVNYSQAEPFGRVIIESLAMGTPVIVNNTGGAPEIIRDVGYGKIVDSESVEELSNGIIEMSKNIKSQEEVMQFINKVKKNYDAQLPSERLFDVINKLCH